MDVCTSGKGAAKDRLSVAVHRKRRSDGERSHRSIMEAATALATVRGLEGLSIGELAAATGMSKGGLYAHFGSKQELQLATIAAATEIVAAQVTRPALRLREPITRLRAVCENFLLYAERTFPGGCFFASVSAEMDTRAGIVRDHIAEQHTEWMNLLTELVDDAREAGELNMREKKPAQLAFEIDAYLHLGNDAYVLHQEPEQLNYARSAICRLLDQHTPDQRK